MVDLYFPEIQGKLGFGCMRLPVKDGNVDYTVFNQMVDVFLESGMNYFDTAHSYIGGKSEIAFRDCVANRHSRSTYLLANKLTDAFFKQESDIRPFINQQLTWCGVEYFDFYLMHAQNQINYQKFKICHAYEKAIELKAEGKIRHFGISFHDKPKVLDMILSEHPEIEIVQIQLNYLDYEDVVVESRNVLEVCQKYGKPVIVMEPIKGGNLVNLPSKADAIFRDLNAGTNASYALRFAASFSNIAMVLSGMNNMEQLVDNLNTMRIVKPLNEKETDAIYKVCSIFRSLNLIPCTYCRYCIEESSCPMGIRIPDMFSSLNAHESFHDWNAGYYYNKVITGKSHGKASECIHCGKCEKVCPQHLPIRDLLKKVAETFE